MKNRLHSILRQALFPILFCIIVCGKANAQHLLLNFGDARVEAGLNFGPTFFLGDLGGKVGKGTTFIKDLNYELTKLMKGAFISVYPTDWMGFRLAAQYTYLEGRDNIINTHGVDELWRKQRNLDFKSNVWEAYTALEFFPIGYFNRGNDDYEGRFRPYVFVGVGLFHFNPKGSLTDQNGNVTWHELQRLKTEGQDMPEYPGKKQYSLMKMNIPYGGGFKYLLSEKVNIGLELLYRKTFTDYIDDVSTTYIDPNDFDKNLNAADAAIARQIHDKTVGIVTPGVNRYDPGVQRGNPNNKDAYFSFLFKLGINLKGGDGENGNYGSASSRMKCPVRF
jgi:hypothetical protein